MESDMRYKICGRTIRQISYKCYRLDESILPKVLGKTKGVEFRFCVDLVLNKTDKIFPTNIFHQKNVSDEI